VPVKSAGGDGSDSCDGRLHFFADVNAHKGTHPMHSRFLIAGVSFVIALFTSAQAQVTIEVSKITCDQFVHGKVGPARSVGRWLSGFYNGRRGNTNFDLKTFDANLNKLEHFCFTEKNFNVPVMQAIEQMFGEPNSRAK
jgi:hypothetical protein